MNNYNDYVTISGNQIHPTATIVGDVVMGSDNQIGQNTIIQGPVKIGNNNKIFPNCVIGTPAQHLEVEQDWATSENQERVIEIGDNNLIREFTTIHKPTDEITKIHNDCFIMAYNHIPHDCEIFDNVLLANNCQISGHTKILEHASLALSVVVHQYSTIGSYAMVGMGTIVTKDIYPFAKVVGNPAYILGTNTIGMERKGFSEKEIKAAEQIIKHLRFRSQDSIRPTAHPKVDICFNEFLKKRYKKRKCVSFR